MAKGGRKNHPVSMGRSYFLFQWHPLSPEITCASHFVTALSSPLAPHSGNPFQRLKAGTKMHGQGGKEKPACVNGEEFFSFPIASIEPRNILCKPFCDCLVIPPWASKWPLLCRGSKQAPRCMAKGGRKNHPVSMGRSYFLFQ